MAKSLSPFPRRDELFSKLIDQKVLPDVAETLAIELSCPVLDALYPHLDLISRKSSSHIDPLHVHLRKRRAITITEDPGLHLVWHADSVYIKPLPGYLLSWAFWEEHLPLGSASRADAIGFVRTYSHLIRHPSDFYIAQKEDLIPRSEKLLYSEFEAFIHHFRDIGDEQVSPRWEFGQFRLTWLNWVVRVLQPETHRRGGMFRRLFYEEQYHQTGQFVREFGAPLLFLFATLSLILSSMQVVLAARPNDPWEAFASVSAGFSVAVIVMLVALFVVILFMVAAIWVLQIAFALRSRRKRTEKGPA